MEGEKVPSECLKGCAQIRVVNELRGCLRINPGELGDRIPERIRQRPAGAPVDVRHRPIDGIPRVALQDRVDQIVAVVNIDPRVARSYPSSVP